jgi:hypothetical protein
VWECSLLVRGVGCLAAFYTQPTRRLELQPLWLTYKPSHALRPEHTTTDDDDAGAAASDSFDDEVSSESEQLLPLDEEYLDPNDDYCRWVIWVIWGDME